MRLTSKGHQALQETIAWTGALVAFSGIYYVLYGRKTPKETESKRLTVRDIARLNASSQPQLVPISETAAASAPSKQQEMA